MIEDKLLIYRFKRGSGEALEQIYLKYKNYLLKLAVVLCGDVNLAEDIVQDVFVNFAQSADRIRQSGSLKSFLATCVLNRFRNNLRDEKTRRTSGLDKAGCLCCNAHRPAKWAIISEQLELLRSAMAKLPENQREVVALYMQGDLTFRQIAKLQNVSINTIQGRYRYGIEKLRSMLNGEAEK